MEGGDDTGSLILRFGLTVFSGFLFINACKIGLHFWKIRKNKGAENIPKTNKITPVIEPIVLPVKKKAFRVVTTEGDREDPAEKMDKVNPIPAKGENDRNFSFGDEKSSEIELGNSLGQVKRLKPRHSRNSSEVHGLMKLGESIDLEGGITDRPRDTRFEDREIMPSTNRALMTTEGRNQTEWQAVMTKVPSKSEGLDTQRTEIFKTEEIQHKTRQAEEEGIQEIRC